MEQGARQRPEVARFAYFFSSRVCYLAEIGVPFTIFEDSICPRIFIDFLNRTRIIQLCRITRSLRYQSYT